MSDTEALGAELRDLGVLRIATLEDGSSWCLATAEHLANAAVSSGCSGLQLLK